MLGSLDALRVVRAQGEPLGHDPVRKPSSIPFGADVGTGPRDHPESHLFHELDEALELAQVGAALLRLVVIPENVSLNGVEAGAPEFHQAVAPERPRATRVVERAAEDERVATVDRETVGVVANDV